MPSLTCRPEGATRDDELRAYMEEVNVNKAHWNKDLSTAYRHEGVGVSIRHRDTTNKILKRFRPEMLQIFTTCHRRKGKPFRCEVSVCLYHPTSVPPNPYPKNTPSLPPLLFHHRIRGHRFPSAIPPSPTPLKFLFPTSLQNPLQRHNRHRSSQNRCLCPSQNLEDARLVAERESSTTAELGKHGGYWGGAAQEEKEEGGEEEEFGDEGWE